MIKFDNISKFDWKYEQLYYYVRFAHNLIFYRKYQVENLENIPKGVPVIAVCNHQNGLSDALGILFAFNRDGRRVVFIARADIFRKDLWAKLLKYLKIMPAFRATDLWSGGDLSENDEIFNQSAKILADENKVVCLFPEAGHQDRHTLGPFKKGFARIAFKAAEMLNFEKPIYILPMGNHYSNYFSFQSKLLINIGEPFEFSDLYPLYKEHPEKAQKMLVDRARPMIENLMLNISDTEHYEQYEMLCKMYAKDYKGKYNLKPSDFKNELTADKKIVESVEKLKEEDPSRFKTLMDKTLQYIRDLEKLHLRDWIFSKKISVSGTIVRFLLCLVLLPFIIFGMVVNFIPFNASTMITRKIKDPMLHSSFHIVAGILFAFPIWYIIVFLVLLIFVRWWIALIYVILLPISLIIYFRGKIMWLKMYNRIRRFQFWFKGNRFFNEATALRREIIAELNKIVN
ncbi:MAG: 1-acyl-sn-glycerol-3-phosphate acyltransferase [Prevotellaceae bacterium]|jgi:1-acyl-sn-glycerol-3-phosphate acyltransferase|nr:1-acyl-sn-glycerol-3-phosphate acyltransferase [Prevotellaceae bacterium]